jgi:uncharacterized repeat protein (TIGR02543 family)
MRKITLLKLGFMLVLCGLLAVSCSKGSSGGDDPQPTPNNGGTNNNGSGDNGGGNGGNNNGGNDNGGGNGNTTTEYTLSFDVNGATGSIEPIKFTTDAKIPDASVVKYDKHTFLGWSTDKNATSPEYKAGDTYKGKTATLYAIWTEVFKITYTFNDNVKTSEFTAVDFSNGTALINCEVPLKDNEVLVWKDKDGNTYENGAKVPKAADLDLTADISNKVSGGATSEEWQYKDYFNNN